MQTRITRPDIRVPDEFQWNLDETMLGWIEDGLQVKINDLYLQLDAHTECDLRSETGCMVRQKWIIGQYGDLLTAREAGTLPTDCTEDLTFLHTQMGRLMDVLAQARYLHRNPHSRGMYERSEAETQLLAIKGEVAYREEVGAVKTGPMPKLTPEELDKLDKAKSEGSLLGLDAPAEATVKQEPKTKANK